MNFKNPLIASILLGFVLVLAWIDGNPMGMLCFFFFGIFILLEKTTQNKKWFHVIAILYPGLLIWNLGTTWWLANATLGGMIFTVLANSLLMCLPFLALRATRKIIPDAKRTILNDKIVFILYWLSFEFLHMQWELAWPWLSLGNNFNFPMEFIQWYSYTGVLGGSLWTLLLGFAFIKFFDFDEVTRKFNLVFSKKALIKFLVLLLIPIGISLLLLQEESEEESIEALIIQPNIDPYLEKFEESEDYIAPEDQVRNLIQLSSEKVRNETKLLIWPETSIPTFFRLRKGEVDGSDPFITQFLEEYPQLSLIAGGNTYQMRDPKNSKDYAMHNSAIFQEGGNVSAVYHKSKLVPGVESLPYANVLKFMSKFAIDLGGASGALIGQKERIVFTTQDSIKLAPIICYESVYGGFIKGFMDKGASIITVVTNDGWWGNTAGHKQHLHFSQLRAIEYRRPVLRSANTGISCVIDINGKIKEQLPYDERGTILTMVKPNKTVTFYAKTGDYLGKLAVFCSLIILLIALVHKLTNGFEFRISKK